MQPLIEYEQSTGLVREVYDDIRATRKTDDINNFWKAIAHHPPTLQRTWAMLKEVMGGPGELDPLVRELIYIAVSVTNGCDYCIASHRACGSVEGHDRRDVRRVDEHRRCCQSDQPPGYRLPRSAGREVQVSNDKRNSSQQDPLAFNTRQCPFLYTKLTPSLTGPLPAIPQPYACCSRRRTTAGCRRSPRR